VTVDLYGQPADYDAIGAVCEARDLLLVADAAQSFGGACRGQRVGRLGDITTTSFFPSKPLGCYGDGGAIFTDDANVAERLRSVRVHGRGTSKYDNVRLGLNARLDTLQAAILLEKLRLIDEERDARARVAAAYNERLPSTISVPAVRADATSAWAYYTVRVDHRDETAAALAAAGVSTAIYYPTPLHRQPAYAEYPRATEDLGVCDALAATVLSLPMHAYLDEASQNRVIEAVTDAVAGRSWPTGGARGSAR
jgi:dTDP-4-amino-4,6-dideoxygalactose transaminase